MPSVTTPSRRPACSCSPISNAAASVYPDSNKIAIWAGNEHDNLIVRRSSGVGYWDGETGAAD